MKLEDLTQENLMEIVRVYEEICGYGRDFRKAMYQEPASVLENLRLEKQGDYRIGSKWDGNSKLFLNVDHNNHVEVSFNSNFDPRERKGKKYDEAEKAGQEFVSRVNNYLRKK